MDKTYIKRLISEMVSNELNSLLKEAQITNGFSSKINDILSNIKLDVPESYKGKFNDSVLKSEFKNALQSKINKIQKKSYDFGNLYIMKLGTNKIKDGKNIIDLNLSNIPHDLPEGFYPNTFGVIVYKDSLVDIFPVNDFVALDKFLNDKANDFIRKNKITLSRTGEDYRVVIFNEFNNPNIIDLTDYSTYQSKTIKPTEPVSLKAKEKADYRAGRPVDHPKFGKGTIISTKLKETTPDGIKKYYVTVDFPKFGQKVILMQSKGKS